MQSSLEELLLFVDCTCQKTVEEVCVRETKNPLNLTKKVAVLTIELIKELTELSLEEMR